VCVVSLPDQSIMEDGEGAGDMYCFRCSDGEEVPPPAASPRQGGPRPGGPRRVDAAPEWRGGRAGARASSGGSGVGVQ